MEIITRIVEFDKQILLLINSMHNGYFDTFMFSFSKVAVWIPFYLSVIYILFKSAGKKAIWFVLLLILGVVLADQLSGLIKNLIERPRPTHHTVIARFLHVVNNYTGGPFGFVSSHAANTAGFAVLSSLLIRQKPYTFATFIWVAVTCYSRIYLGVHYPLDVVGGLLLGVCIAFILYAFYERILPTENQILKIERIKIPITTLLITIGSILLYSVF